MYKILFIISFILLSGFSFGQNSGKLDSLINLLQSQNDDSIKVKSLIKISEEFYLTDIPMSLKYAELALRLSEKIDFKRGIGMSYSRIGIGNDAAGNFPAAFEARLNELKTWKSMNSKKGICAALAGIGVSYSDQGNFSKALEYYFQSLQLAEEVGYTEKIIANLCEIGRVNSLQGNLEDALEYFSKSLKIANENDFKQLATDNLSNIGDIYCKKGNYSEAIKYFILALEGFNKLGDVGNSSAVLANIGGMFQLQSDSANDAGNLFLGKEKNKKALEYFFKALKISQQYGNKYYQANFLGNIGEIYRKEKQNAEAKNYLLQAIDLALAIKALDEIQVDYQRLYLFYKQIKESDLALEYHEKYVEIKDSIFNEKNKKAISELQIKFKTEKREAENKELTQKNEIQALSIKNNRYFIAGLFCLLIFVLALSVVIFRQSKIKSQQVAVQLEQKLLRTQMNPHFIFNSLASIESFIYEHQPKEAGVYLSRFSRLMRLILESSVAEKISLEKEIELLNYYLSLEKLRLNDNLDYTVEVDNSIDATQLFLPPMLTQPFIENAIEHGFRGLMQKGIIRVMFGLTGNNLLVQITDNGIGFANSQQQKDLNSIHKSMAMQITEERIRFINKSKRKKLHFSVTDIADEKQGNKGTKIVFSIPV